MYFIQVRAKMNEIYESPNPYAAIAKHLRDTGTEYIKSMLDFVIVPLAGHFYSNIATYYVRSGGTAVTLLERVKHVVRADTISDGKDRSSDTELRAIFASSTQWGRLMDKLPKNIFAHFDSHDDHMSYHWSLLGPPLPKRGCADI